MTARNLTVPRTPGSRGAGFTLIELLVVLAIVALIATIAVPSYRSYIIRSQRTDATSALLKIAAAQEKFFLQNNTYATESLRATAQPNGLGIAGSDNGWYTLAIVAPTTACPITECWVATATPTTGERQASDSECTEFRLTSAGVKSAKKGTTDNSANCWRR